MISVCKVRRHGGPGAVEALGSVRNDRSVAPFIPASASLAVPAAGPVPDSVGAVAAEEKLIDAIPASVVGKGLRVKPPPRVVEPLTAPVNKESCPLVAVVARRCLPDIVVTKRVPVDCVGGHQDEALGETLTLVPPSSVMTDRCRGKPGGRSSLGTSGRPQLSGSSSGQPGTSIRASLPSRARSSR